MNVFNDRTPGSMETWVDDSGKLRHFTLVQNTGFPMAVYLDGVEVRLVPKLPTTESRVIPDGWKLVPIEPTRFMVDAMIKVDEGGYYEMYSAALNAAPERRVPDGWKLVPIEPTREMNFAGDSAATMFAKSSKGFWYWGAIYRAMLNAAPERRVFEWQGERKIAEHEYITTAFNYPEAPIGSRDWTLFWQGWQAALNAVPAKGEA